MIGNSWWAKAARRLMPIAVFSAAVCSRLVGTPAGWLFVAAGGFWWVTTRGLVTPLTGPELIAFLVSEPDVFTALIGLVLAYAAISTWKDQKRTELRLAAGTEIQEFFYKAGTDLYPLFHLSGEYLQLKREIAEGADPEQLKSRAKWLIEHLGEAQQARDALSRASVEMHALRVRHGAVLMTSLVATVALERAIKNMGDLANLIWFPIIEWATEPEELLFTVERTDSEKWTQFRSQGNATSLRMQMWAGLISGRFAGALFRPGLWSAYFTHKQMKAAASASLDE